MLINTLHCFLHSLQTYNWFSMARYLPKDDGKAGAIREAGGAFGKMEAAREDQYFYNLVTMFNVLLFKRND